MDRKKKNYLYSQILCTENPKDSMKKRNVSANKHSTKFQDTKPTYNNQWCIYKPVINNQKGNEENQGIPPKTKKHPKIRQDTDPDAGKYIYVCVCVCMYVCIYIYIYI